MCGITSEAKSTTRMQLRALLQEQDCSIKELIEETGLSHATISRRIGLWIKSGDVVVVQKTMRNFPGWGTTVAARYAWADKSRKYHDEAEALIYRLIDRLLDTELDADGIGLIKEASRFINWDVPNANVCGLPHGKEDK